MTALPPSAVSVARTDLVERHGGIGLSAWLLVFIWLLPFHVLIIAWLFGGLALPESVVRGIAAWKEGLVILLLTAVVVRALRGRGAGSPVQWLDVSVAGLVGLAMVYFLRAGVWFGLDVPIGARVYGFRDLVYWSLLYFVGRATPEIVRDERVLKALFLVGVITSAVAVTERLFVTPAMLTLFGAAEYFQNFLGAPLWTAGNVYGLPNNYWTTMGGHLVRRAGSTYLSSQTFAIPFLIIVPAVTVWLLERKRIAIAWLGYALVWLGLLLTVTRMTIVACLLQSVAIAATRRRWGLIANGGAALVLATTAALLIAPDLATYVWDTLTWQSGS